MTPNQKFDAAPMRHTRSPGRALLTCSAAIASARSPSPSTASHGMSASSAAVGGRARSRRLGVAGLDGLNLGKLRIARPVDCRRADNLASKSALVSARIREWAAGHARARLEEDRLQTTFPRL